MLRIVHPNETRDVKVRRKETLLSVLRREGFEVQAPCGGTGGCGKCKVLVRHRVRGFGRKSSPDLVEVLACATEAIECAEVHLADSGLVHMQVSLAGSDAIAGAASQASAKVSREASLAVAFDIGSTTLVCRLYDLSSGTLLAQTGAVNPQRSFGADVISRISAVQNGHLSDLVECINNAMASMIETVVGEVGAHASQVSQVAVAGNTVMQCLVAGLDPTPIGAAPFTPPSLFGGMFPVRALAEAGCTAQEAYFAPCVAGYVGGDITADILSCGIADIDTPVLLVDLGTNGEMALGSRAGIVCCATAAGPVFEGANIAFGMPAGAGAISQVALNDGELVFSTIDNAPAKGICGSGLIDVVALLVEAGVIEDTGLMLEADEVDASVPACLVERLGEYEDAPAFWLTPNIALTQKDVRNIQLAKGAVHAGILTLMEEKSISASDISRLDVAGGFGQFLNLQNAARIGLFPPELLSVARSVGNAAIEGASLAVTRPQAKATLADITKLCSYIELSGFASFNAFYVESMEF